MLIDRGAAQPDSGDQLVQRRAGFVLEQVIQHRLLTAAGDTHRRHSCRMAGAIEVKRLGACRTVSLYLLSSDCVNY